MANESRSRVRYGEAFWRAHHEAWKHSALNQREYCEAHVANGPTADSLTRAPGEPISDK